LSFGISNTSPSRSFAAASTLANAASPCLPSTYPSGHRNTSPRTLVGAPSRTVTVSLVLLGAREPLRLPAAYTRPTFVIVGSIPSTSAS
jgi:hypothetical protein